jgi:hypothetical protein
MSCRNAKEGSESGVTGLAAIEAEDEFVEIGLQMLEAQAVVNAEAPGFQVRKNSVDAGHNDMRRHWFDDMRLVADMGDAGI